MKTLITSTFAIMILAGAAGAAGAAGTLAPAAPVGADRTGRTAIDWGVYGVPETFIIDGYGRIAYKHVGPISESSISEKLLPAIKKARKALPPS